MCAYAYRNTFCNVFVFSLCKIICLRVNNMFEMLNYLFSMSSKLFGDVDLFVRDIYFYYLAYTIKCS